MVHGLSKQVEHLSNSPTQVSKRVNGSKMGTGVNAGPPAHCFTYSLLLALSEQHTVGLVRSVQCQEDPCVLLLAWALGVSAVEFSSLPQLPSYWLVLFGCVVVVTQGCFLHQQPFGFYLQCLIASILGISDYWIAPMGPTLILIVDLHSLSQGFEAHLACSPQFQSVESPFRFKLVLSFMSVDSCFSTTYILYMPQVFARELPNDRIVPHGQIWIRHISPSITLSPTFWGFFTPTTTAGEIPASL